MDVNDFYRADEKAVYLYPQLHSDLSALTLVQYTLFDIRPYFRQHMEAPMKGVWSKEKSQASNVRTPAMNSITSCDAKLLAEAIQTVINQGCALTFSMTRDKGAVVITLLDGDQRAKVYVEGAQETTEALSDLKESFTRTDEDISPPVKASRSR